MSELPRIEQLLDALKSLTPAEQQNLLQRVRGTAAAPPKAVLRLHNRGEAPCEVAVGAAPAQTLNGGESLDLSVEPLPLLRGSDSPAVLDRSGLPSAPKSLLSLRLAAAAEHGAALRVDLAGWIANAARCGWPFAYHRSDAGPWQAASGAVFDLDMDAASGHELVVLGLGVDLSELAERFTLAFEPAMRGAAAEQGETS